MPPKQRKRNREQARLRKLEKQLAELYRRSLMHTWGTVFEVHEMPVTKIRWVRAEDSNNEKV